MRSFQPLEASLVYVPLPLAALVGTQIAPRLIAKLAPRDVLAIGLTVQSISLGGWALTSTETVRLMTGLIAPATPWGFGLGLSIVSLFVICTSSIAGPETGAVSGFATSAYQGGGRCGIRRHRCYRRSHRTACHDYRRNQPHCALDWLHVAMDPCSDWG